MLERDEDGAAELRYVDRMSRPLPLRRMMAMAALASSGLCACAGPDVTGVWFNAQQDTELLHLFQDDAMVTGTWCRDADGCGTLLEAELVEREITLLCYHQQVFHFFNLELDADETMLTGIASHLDENPPSSFVTLVRR